jgi:hypothetical protein
MVRQSSWSIDVGKDLNLQHGATEFMVNRCRKDLDLQHGATELERRFPC